MKKFKLENVKKGDSLIYKDEECVVLFKFRKEIPRDYYHTRRPVFRVEFEDGHRMNLSVRNEKLFSFSDVEPEYDTDDYEDDSVQDLAHYREIASAME
jgi:hypothetical protein